jgi:hypothetical protein
MCQAVSTQIHLWFILVSSCILYNSNTSFVSELPQDCAIFIDTEQKST